MTKSFRPKPYVLLALLIGLFLTGLTSCSEKPSISGTWVRVIGNNTDFDTITELWTFNQDTLYSRLIIEFDSIAYENKSDYSIDTEKGLLTIHILDQERGIDAVTTASIKTLTKNELELFSERNQVLNFKRKIEN